MFSETYTKLITHKTKQSTDFHGNVTYASGDILARVEPYVRTLLDDKGESFTSSSQVFSNATIKAGDSLVIDGVEKVVKIASPVLSLFGGHEHSEVIV
jgi:uncharacterized Zn finger protein